MTETVLEEIYLERRRQDAKWGEQNHPMGTHTTAGTMLRAGAAKLKCEQHAREGTVTWRDILDEEVQEAFAEEDHDALRKELIQVAAVAVAMVECIDRKHKAAEEPKCMWCAKPISDPSWSTEQRCKGFCSVQCADAYWRG